LGTLVDGNDTAAYGIVAREVRQLRDRTTIDDRVRSAGACATSIRCIEPHARRERERRPGERSAFRALALKRRRRKNCMPSESCSAPWIVVRRALRGGDAQAIDPVCAGPNASVVDTLAELLGAPSASADALW
jgi:hypothetical protein